MRILFITGLTGYGIGGARTEEIRLIRGAEQRRCIVAMCSDILGDELAGIPHFRLDYPPGDKAPEQVSRAVGEFKPDIVHVVGGGVRFLEVCDRTLQNVPWIFTAHNVPPAERIFPHLYGSQRLHYAARNLLAMPNVWTWSRYLKHAGFRAAICHSKTVGDRLQNCGCPPGKIREIPFGSELPASAPALDALQPSPFPQGASPRILTVAGLANHKGQLDGIRMAVRLVQEFPNLSYLFVGMARDKRYRTYLEKMIQHHGLSRSVQILNLVPEETKLAALRDADLYIQPSHEEGFCIAFLEAAMMCPRLIGADTGAIAAIAEGDPHMRIVRPRDMDGLGRAARELLREPVSQEEIALRRQRLEAKYSWDAYLDQHVEVYSKILSRR